MVDIIKQTIEVNDVDDVVVTTIEEQEADGTFVREVRIMTKTDLQTQAVETFVLRLVSSQEAKLHMTTPQIEY